MTTLQLLLTLLFVGIALVIAFHLSRQKQQNKHENEVLFFHPTPDTWQKKEHRGKRTYTRKPKSKRGRPKKGRA